MKKIKYYWDSCIFVAWITDEKRPPGEMEGLSEIIEEMEKGEAVIVTSVMTANEVFEYNLTSEQKQRLESTLKNPDIALVNVNLRISEKGRELREFYHQQKHALKLPDSIHLATALLFEVNKLHTFDDKLLRYDGNVMGKNLKICKPMSKQPKLNFSNE